MQLMSLSDPRRRHFDRAADQVLAASRLNTPRSLLHPTLFALRSSICRAGTLLNAHFEFDNSDGWYSVCERDQRPVRAPIALRKRPLRGAVDSGASGSCSADKPADGGSDSSAAAAPSSGAELDRRWCAGPDADGRRGGLASSVLLRDGLGDRRPALDPLDDVPIDEAIGTMSRADWAARESYTLSTDRCSTKRGSVADGT